MSDSTDQIIDLDARYSVAGYEGVAFYLRGFATIYDSDEDETIEDPDWVRAVMVGDDREHIIETCELTMIADDDYCSSCGQIGCTHDAR